MDACGFLLCNLFQATAQGACHKVERHVTTGRLAGTARRVVEVPAGLEVRLFGQSQTEIVNELTRLETEVP